MNVDAKRGRLCSQAPAGPARRAPRRPFGIPIGLVVVLAVSAGPVHGESIAFEASLRDGPRAATVEVLEFDGVPYVSLSRIIEQFGGGQSLLASRMRADFANMTAWLQYDDTRVNAMSLFSLRWKAIKQGNDVLIARDDVPMFFDSAFRTEVSVSKTPMAMQDGPGEARDPAVPVAEALGGRSPRLTEAESVRAADKPIEALVIDAGHGGYDAGAELAPALQEKNVTLAIALKIKALLERDTKIKIVATRDADMDIGVKQRALLAANEGGDFVVSIHIGASFSRSSRGPALFFTPGRAEHMAKAVAAQFAASAAAPLRGIYEAPLRLPGLANAPGLLVEVGCITNEQDALMLQTPEFADAIAADIAAGIAEFLASQSTSPPV